MQSISARLRYHGTGGSLFGLMLGNMFLTLLTFGIYSFWAKNKIRQFHYSHTELDGDRFAYHGTGGELLAGAAKAMGILIVLSLMFNVASVMLETNPTSAVVPIVLMLAAYGVIVLLVPIAINGARRYRMSRSSWRGIRFSFIGRWQEFLGVIVTGSLLTAITLGFYLPAYQNQRRAFLVRHTRFGSERFGYDGDGRELLGQYIKTLLLTIPTLGFSWFWYTAFRHRYFWQHTRVAGARFRSEVTGRGLMNLYVGNVLLAFVTLGIAMPWVITRTHAFWCENVTLRGTVDWAAIEQRAHRVSATAEGLAEAFDVDLGLVG